MHNLSRKFLFGFVMATLVMWTLGPVRPASAITAGDLVKGPNSDAVYYIGANGKKYVFPDAKTYFTWYRNFNGIQTVTVSVLDNYPDGGAVTYRPGTRMVKTVDTNKVYAVEPGGMLRWVTDEASAAALWGANWNKRINDVIPGYFASTYTVAANLGSTYPTGSLIQKTGDPTVYYVDGTTIRPFATGDAFDANGFDWADIVMTASLTGYTTGSSITGEESALSSIQASSQLPVAAGTLSASLASDTPASGLTVGGAARYLFTKVNLSAGANPVTIDQIVVKRGGLGQDAAFASVDILDGNTMLPFDPNSKSFNSEHQATFNKDVTVPANTTWPIYLSGNMASSLANYAGEVPTLGISAMTLTAGSTLNASLPIYGNYQNLNGTITIGTAEVAPGSYQNATSTQEVGKQDYTFFSFQVAAGSDEDVQFSQVTIYQASTAVLGDDLQNIELFRDTTKLATCTTDGKYAPCLFTALTIPKGQTYQFQVKADVENGSGRDVDLGIYRSTDLLVKGVTYGYNITPTYTGKGSDAGNPRLTDNAFHIGNGSMTVERSSTVGAGNIAIGNDQVLGAFKFTVKGEPIDITALTLTFTSSATATIEDALKSVKLVNASGATVAGPTDVTAHALTVAFTDTFTMPVGETVLKVVGTLATNGGWATNDTIYATINTPRTKITSEGQVSGNAIDETPTTAVDTNTQTIKAAKLAVTRNSLPANATIVAGSQDVLLGSWNFSASDSGEDVRVTSMAFAASSSNATNLTVFVDGTAQTPVNDAPSGTGGDDDGVTSTFAFDTPIVFTKGTAKTITMKGDIASSAAANDSAQFGLTDGVGTTNDSVVAYGVSTGNRATVNVTADNGAVFTYAAAGAVTVSNYNNPVQAIVRAGATGVTYGYVKFDAIREDLDLDDLTIYVADGAITGTADGTYLDSTKVYVYDDAVLIESVSIPSTNEYQWTFANGKFTVPVDGSNILTIKSDVATINVNTDNAPGTPAADIRFGLGGKIGFTFTGVGSNTVIAAGSETYNGSTTTAMVIHKAVPTVTFSQSGSPMGATGTLTSGANNLFAFKVAADSAGTEVLIYRASFEIATGGDGVIDVTVCYLKNSDGQIISSASATPTDVDGTTNNFVSFVFDNPTISAGNAKEAISIAPGASSTFTLNCTLGGAGLETGDYVSIALLGDTASSTPAASHGTPDATGQNVADAWSVNKQGNFVWSDNYKNRGLATDNANATAYGQWYDGFLVSGLGQVVTSTAYTVSMP